jgi:hypothetical protein
MGDTGIRLWICILEISFPSLGPVVRYPDKVFVAFLRPCGQIPEYYVDVVGAVRFYPFQFIAIYESSQHSTLLKSE